MYKYLLLCFIIILQSCSSVKNNNIKVPSKYPITVHFSSPCCGTASQEPICNFMSNFLQHNKISNIQLIYNPCLHCEEGEYTLFFPLNDINEKQRNDFIKGMKNIVSNIKPQSESEGTIVLTEWNKKIRLNKYKCFK